MLRPKFSESFACFGAGGSMIKSQSLLSPLIYWLRLDKNAF